MYSAYVSWKSKNLQQQDKMNHILQYDQFDPIHERNEYLKSIILMNHSKWLKLRCFWSDESYSESVRAVSELTSDSEIITFSLNVLKFKETCCLFL